MKKFLFLLMAAFLFISFTGTAFCRDVYVHGYTRRDGTYGQPHYRTSPDSTRNNNYSTYGNVNPYTGQYGTKPRDNGYSYPNSFGSGNDYQYGNKTRNTYGF